MSNADVARKISALGLVVIAGGGERRYMTPDGGIGRWFVRAGYVVMLVGGAAAVVLSVRNWGERSSVALLGCVVVLWAGSGFVAYGRKLLGQLAPGAFRISRGIVSLPVSLVLAYYGPTIEHFGVWWALLLPHLTYGFLAGVGLPHLLALILTVIVAPLELIATAIVSQVVIVTPLSAILGSDNPVVGSVREHIGGISITDDPLETTGRQETTAWGGTSNLQ